MGAATVERSCREGQTFAPRLEQLHSDTGEHCPAQRTGQEQHDDESKYSSSHGPSLTITGSHGWARAVAGHGECIATRACPSQSVARARAGRPIDRRTTSITSSV